MKYHKMKAEDFNLDKVQHEKIRRNIDPIYTQYHNDLSEAYYAFWQDGLSHPVTIGSQTFDVLGTPEESKELYDKLSAGLWAWYETKMDEENKKLKKKDQYDLDTQFITKNDKGEIIEDRLANSKQRIQDLHTEGILFDI